jgi:MFS family permease
MNKFFPWLMVMIAMLALTFSNGMGITGLPIFDQSLLDAFGWDRENLKRGPFITFALTALLAPIAGIVIDKVGVKKVMALGFLLLTISYYLLSQMQSLTDMYIAYALLGAMLACAGLNANMILVSSWFQKNRGTAIGLALVGTSLGGTIMPQIGNQLIARFDWRTAFQYEMFIAVAMLTLVILVVRNTPQGNGNAESSAPAFAAISDDDISYSAALRTGTFWALAIIAMTTFYTVLAISSHLILHLTDFKFERQMAANALSTFFICAMVGKFLFGFLADLIDQKKVLMANLVVMLSGAVCLALMNPATLWLAVIALGFGWGGIYTLIQLTAINSFGLSSAGKILGTITILDALGGGMGIWLTGYLYETSGKSYALAFQIFCGMLILALLAATRIRQVKRVAEPA